MDIIILATTGAFVLLVALTIFLKRKSIKAFFESIERKKEWAQKRHLFLEKMNEGVNPFLGYQMISYKMNGRHNERAILAYNIPIDDLNCKKKWRSYVNDELKHFIKTLRSHEFKMLEVSDSNGSKRIIRL
jgi:hypothetical protein